MSADSSTLVGLLRRRALELPDGIAYVFLQNGETPVAQVTWSELDRLARAVAADLQATNAAGERALLLYPPGLEFVAAFFGCVYAGTIAVPAYPPRSERDRDRIDAILDDADAAYALSTARLLPTMRERIGRSRPQRTRWLASDASASDRTWRDPAITAESLAYLQYTSGSTALPKGVMVSHHNVASNLDAIDRMFAHDADSVSITWLPHFHDMGLVYGLLAPVHRGFTCVVMSPAAFVQRPVRWLEAISRYKGTHSGGPNFAYRLCARRVTAAERLELDLSRWRVAFNGAEPIRWDTLDAFFETFHPCGFNWSAFYPAYGLAEATLKVSGGFVRGDNVRASRASAEPAPVGCGRADRETEIRIVDHASLAAARPGEVGEIWVRGPAVAVGYWNRPAETRQAFGACLPTGEGPYLRTGDLGFMLDGELFVAGRLKDLIIVCGANHHPEDIEQTAARSHPALREGFGAAFSAPIAGEERLVLVYEVERRSQIDAPAIARTLRRALSEDHQLQLSVLLLIEAGTLPRTPSGKIRRHACRSAFLQRSLAVVHEVVDEPALADAHRTPLTPEAVLAAPSAERTLLVEEYLTAVASEAAGVRAPVDAHLAFSSWGLDSLTAIELRHRIETDLGLQVPVGRFLDGTTPHALAETVVAALEQQPRVHVDEVGADADTAEYPASYGQRAHLFSQRWSSDGALYNLAAAFHVRRPLDMNALRGAIQALVDNHASLRSGFVMRGEEPIAVERRHDRACVAFEDAVGWDQALLERRLNDEAARPFDLEEGPLLRATAFARAPAEWILLLVVHHVAADFRSFEVLLEELACAYVSGPSHARQHVTRSPDYADFARWQRRMLAGPEGERLWAYWQAQLRPPWPVLDLGDRITPAQDVQEPSGSVPLRIDSALWTKVQRLARSGQSTAFAALLAAFQVLLHRRTGETDIRVGCPMLGRSLAEFARVVGYFVNPVVLRTELGDDPTWTALLDRVRHTLHEALEHQDYPFALLVERLRVARDPARSPLFQVMLVWQDERLLHDGTLAALSVGDVSRPLELGGLTLEPIPLSPDAARYELTVMMAPGPSGVTGCIKYDRSRWEAAGVEHLARQFVALLEAIVANPMQRCSSLPLDRVTSRPATGTAVRDAGSGTGPLARELTIHELFESQVSRQPGATAVVCGADRLTYAELNARANQLARYLLATGAGVESLVGLCLERNIWILPALVGVWKCGAAYVPLDPTYPPERLARLVTGSRLRTLVTHSTIAPRLPNGHARTVLIDAEWTQIAAHGEHNLERHVTPSQMAYAIYTSGSTGVPKGVIIEHRSVANLYRALRERIYAAAPPALSVALNASFGFDASVKQIVMLAHGSTIHVLPDAVRSSASGVLAYAASYQIDVLDCTPSFLRALVAAGLLSAAYPRMILAGGEPIDRGLWRAVGHEGHALRVYNVYGPTECTVDATACRVQGGAPHIGFPLANVQAHVVDPSLAAVPPGVVGELCIGGACVARGYLHAPDVTAARFVPDPFSDAPGARLYRTGDLARRSLDGSLEFIRRADDQMKVRGFRVEPGEVETTLRRHAGVRDAAVVKVADGFGDDQLVAYVVPAGEGAAGSADLRAFLRASLPAFMMPSVFVAVDRLPLTRHGKLDRAALASIRPCVIEDRAAGVSPATHLEEVLATMWARALRVTGVGMRDNFFELGGHSLLAMRVSAELEQMFPVAVPLLPLLFENATIERFADAMVRHRAGEIDFERIAEMVQQLDAISDDGAENLLRTCS